MSTRIQHILTKVRRKLQLEVLLTGLAIIATLTLAASVLSSLILVRHNFSDEALFWIRLAASSGALFLLFRYLIRPIWSAPSTRRVARLLEERHPALQDRLSTAVELQEAPGSIHPEVQALIETDALRKLRPYKQPRFFHPQASLASLVAVCAALAVFSVLFLAGPEAYRYSLGKIVLGWYDQTLPPLYFIDVRPGDVRIAKRSDLEIGAQLQGFGASAVKLMARYENQPHWEEALMRPSPDGSEFQFFLFDVRDPLDYFVEADGIRSDVFRVQLSELARVENLKIELQFPAYTGMKNVTLEDEGDIRALTGTKAEVRFLTSAPVRGARLKFDDGREVGLSIENGAEVSGSLVVSKDDYYRIELQDEEGFWNPGSPEYSVVSLPDQPPTINFRRPGRDRKVTNLEEVFTELNAEDDFGIQRLVLRYSVNGGSEQEVRPGFARGSRSLTSSHTFYLEEYDLLPGDFVSYYAEAADGAGSTARTDIYFLEVEPYDRAYFQSQQMGGGAAAEADQDLLLSRRQKDIIAATFNLIRDRELFDSSRMKENSQTLAIAQQRLQTEARTIVERIVRRETTARDPMFRKMIEFLNQAIEHMEPAHGHLNQMQLAEALPEEQKSLQQLLRAEALFKEIQVSFSQNASTGSPSAQDLADLVDLELDKTKNQYETLQQSRQASRDQALDETLERLKELARRQQQEVERRRQSMQGSGGSPTQDQILEEAERMARQLERLSREERNQQLAELSRQLQQAARDMRQSQASGQSSSESQMRAQRALERLQQAQEALGRQRQDRMAQNLQEVKEKARNLMQRQQEILSEIGRLDEMLQKGETDQEFMRRMRRLLRDKSEQQQDLYGLEGDLHQTARQLESRESEASRRLKQAGHAIRDQRLPEKMQEGSQFLSRGWTDMARGREQGVARELEEIAEKIQQAERALGQGTEPNPQQRLQQALNEVGRLVEGLDSIRERASGQQPSSGEPAGETSEHGEQAQRESTSPSQDGEAQGERPGSQAQGDSDASAADSSGASPAPGGAAGSESSGGEFQGGGVTAGVAVNTGISPTQARREWQQRLQEVQEIRPLLSGRPDLTRNLQQLERELRRIDMERIFNDPEELARLKSQIIDGFRQLELEISRSLQEERSGTLRLVNEDEVPPEFREHVEEYYRSLSRRSPRQP